MKKHPLGWLLAALAASILLTLMVGRYPVSVSGLFDAGLTALSGDPLNQEQRDLVFALVYVRLPRICAVLLVGAGLAISGAVYQAIFLNPLVSPGILGVLAGASFGAGIGIVIFESWIATQTFAFLFSCGAVALSLFFAAFFRMSSLLVLLLGGMISSSFFTALTSLLKFVADPNRQLPELTYWLMGSFARVENDALLLAGLPMLALILYLCTQGKATNALSMGDEEAMSLGIAVKSARLRIIAAATLVSTLTVLLAGIVSWIGLVIPHIMRFLIGPDNRALLPASAVGGGVFLLATDSVVRSVFTAELPIGVFTAMVSLPLFAFSLYVNKGGWR